MSHDFTCQQMPELFQLVFSRWEESLLNTREKSSECQTYFLSYVKFGQKKQSCVRTLNFQLQLLYENDSVQCIMQHWLVLFSNNLITDQKDSEDVSDSENISSCSSDSEQSQEAKDDDGEDVAVVQLSWKPSRGPVSLGEWEQHTKVSCLR